MHLRRIRRFLGVKALRLQLQLINPSTEWPLPSLLNHRLRLIILLKFLPAHPDLFSDDAVKLRDPRGARLELVEVGFVVGGGWVGDSGGVELDFAIDAHEIGFPRRDVFGGVRYCAGVC